MKSQYKNQMTVGIQFWGNLPSFQLCLRHDVMHSSNQYSANGLNFIFNISFFV